MIVAPSSHRGLVLGCCLALGLTSVQVLAQQGQRPKPAETPKPAAASAAPSTAPSELALAGLKLTVPAGWAREEVEKGPMAPVAVFRIPKADGPDDGMVRITHYPNMKGKEMDDRNIDRWVSQVAKPDGSPMTRPDAKITKAEAGGAKITIVDISGSVKMTMRDTAKEGHRMIAAILDHPKGPHFIVTAGPTKSMEKWAAQIDAFIKSAKSE